MIEHVYRRAAASPVSDAVMSRPTMTVRDAVEAFGGLAVMTRRTTASGTNSPAEVRRRCRANSSSTCKATSRCSRPDDCEAGTARRDPSIPMGTCVRADRPPRRPREPHVVKVVTRLGSRCLLSRAHSPTREAVVARPGRAFQAHGLYVYRRTFLARLRPFDRTARTGRVARAAAALEHGFRIRVVETVQIRRVDTEATSILRVCGAMLPS